MMVNNYYQKMVRIASTVFASIHSNPASLGSTENLPAVTSLTFKNNVPPPIPPLIMPQIPPPTDLIPPPPIISDLLLTPMYQG